MGSLTLGRVIGAPSPSVPTPATTPIPQVPDTPAPSTPNSPATDNASINEARVNAILQQKRGVAGTIATGWRGLLGLGGNGTLQRKTLLGE